MARGWVGDFYLGFISALGVPTQRGRGLSRGCPQEEVVALRDVPIQSKAIPATCPRRRPPLGRCHPASSELNPFVSEAIQFTL